MVDFEGGNTTRKTTPKKANSSSNIREEPVSSILEEEMQDARDDIRAECFGNGTPYDHDDDRSFVDEDDRDSSSESIFGCVQRSCAEQYEESGRRDGIDNFFDLIETACCGENKTDKLKMNLEGGGKGKTFHELAVCRNFKYSKSNDDEESEDYESATSRSQYSSTSRRSSKSSSRGRPNGRSVSRSHHHRPSHEDMPRQPNRGALNCSSQKKERASNAIAKKASAFISQNVKAGEQDMDVVAPVTPPSENMLQSKPESKTSVSISSKKSAADDHTSVTADSTAIVSRSARSAEHAKLRSACVLSLVCSGSSVSSFDEEGGGHSWSLHTNDRKLKASRSDLTTLTNNKSQVDSDVSVENCRRAVETVINFIYSLTCPMYGNGPAAPVNKAVCLFSLGMILLAWPVDQEKSRRKVQRIEIPRAQSPVSLLRAVLRGSDSKERIVVPSPVAEEMSEEVDTEDAEEAKEAVEDHAIEEEKELTVETVDVEAGPGTSS